MMEQTYDKKVTVTFTKVGQTTWYCIRTEGAPCMDAVYGACSNDQEVEQMIRHALYAANN